MQARRGGKLSGDQATIISAITMLPCVILGHMAYPEGIWKPHEASWYFPVVSGVFFAVATFALYKAYETAPSTVVVPLVQLTAIMMLVTSTVVALLAPFVTAFASEEGAFISFWDAVSYTIILVGGLYPAARGNLNMFLELSFWRQPFVMCILVNDLLMSLTYELLQLATSEQYKMNSEAFVIISTYTMLTVLISVYLVVPHFRREFVGIFYAKRQYIVLCVLCEVFNYAAYWIATYAYQMHQVNVSIVNAAEMALNQIMNLVAAVFLKKVIRFGRETAIEDVGTKVLSCVLVTLGIILATVTTAPVSHGGHGAPEFDGVVVDGLPLTDGHAEALPHADAPLRQEQRSRFPDFPQPPLKHRPRHRDICTDRKRQKKLGPLAYERFLRKCLHLTDHEIMQILHAKHDALLDIKETRQEAKEMAKEMARQGQQQHPRRHNSEGNKNINANVNELSRSLNVTHRGKHRLGENGGGVRNNPAEGA
jgi:hypothetical protein